MTTLRKPSWWYRNSLSIVLFALAMLFLCGQMITGWKEYLEFLKQHQQPEISFGAYLQSGHFFQSTFENWESEFFQMALFVIFTIFLRQQGSSESKGCDGTEDVDKEPKPHKNAPWPVRKGGIILAVYKHSLSLALVFLFMVSFILHWWGSWKDYNVSQALEGLPQETMLAYLGNHRFWFESFQNWQSEFFAVFGLITLSIYLRQKGSPQSKPVDASSLGKTGS